MKLEDGRLVKWQSNGGWQVGCELQLEGGSVVTSDGVTQCALASQEVLVKVWPTGELVFVADCELQDRSVRNDAEPQPIASRGDHCCFACEDAAVEAGRLNPFMRLFIVCPKCGNKRCPKASHHDNDCTASNKPGQPGSRFAAIAAAEEGGK